MAQWPLSHILNGRIKSVQVFDVEDVARSIDCGLPGLVVGMSVDDDDIDGI